MRKTRLGAAIVIAASMFLPLATCTQNGQTTKFVPVRDGGELWSVLLVYALPLLLALIDSFARPQWLRLTALALEPLSIAGSAYVIYFVALLRTPTIWYWVACTAVVIFFITAIVGLVQETRAMRRRSRELRAVLTQ
ncbi:MAG TPA: hypothetical protein VHW00_18595 [Thermoanaerobaculia bacterium]|nr:hypothetical protein [Thermoanaerobaculia bacterium]